MFEFKNNHVMFYYQQTLLFKMRKNSLLNPIYNMFRNENTNGYDLYYEFRAYIMA